MKISNFLFNIMVQKRKKIYFISLVPHNTSRYKLFYGDNFTQYSTVLKSTIHHQSNLCYLGEMPGPKQRIRKIQMTKKIYIYIYIYRGETCAAETTQKKKKKREIEKQRIMYFKCK